MITIWRFLAPAPLSNLRVRHIAFNKGRVGFPMLGQNVKLWFLSSGSAFLDKSQVGGICFGPKWQDCPTISVWECIKGLKPSLGCKHLRQPSPGTGCSFLESTHLFKQPGIAWVSKLGISIRPEALVANWCKYIPLFQNSQQTEYREFHFNRIEFLLWSGIEIKLLKIPAPKVKKN